MANETEKNLQDGAKAVNFTRATLWLGGKLYRLHKAIISEVASEAPRWCVKGRDWLKVHWATVWGCVSSYVATCVEWGQGSLMPALKTEMTSGDAVRIVSAMAVAGFLQWVVLACRKGSPPQSVQPYQPTGYGPAYPQPPMPPMPPQPCPPQSYQQPPQR